jgi:2'-5' RNA ligase
MRLFFALWPPAPVARSLANQADALAERSGGRATRRETIHLTLAFLGDVGEAQLPAVLETARAVAAAPFELKLDRLGFWRHNRLIWAGCESIPPELQTLVNGLREGLRAASLPCDASQAFVPHVTLVRKVGDSRPVLPYLEPPGWLCDRFALVRSQLDLHGAGYETVAEFPLRA